MLVKRHFGLQIALGDQSGAILAEKAVIHIEFKVVDLVAKTDNINRICPHSHARQALKISRQI
jgi:hypothetical protein